MIDNESLTLFQQYNSYKSRIHGPRHWSHVAYLGNKLAFQNELDDASMRCINAFAWTHDLWRTHDGADKSHGKEGRNNFHFLDCELVRKLSDQEKCLVAITINYHSDGYIAPEAYDLGLFDEVDLPEQMIIDTVGCCWDADRLDLIRLGRMPKVELMSTEYWEELVTKAKQLNNSRAL